MTDPNLLAAQATIDTLNAQLDAQKGPPAIYADLQNAPGKWSQINDSGTPQGNLGSISYPPNGMMQLDWTPQVSSGPWRNLYLWRSLPVRCSDNPVYDSIVSIANLAGLNLYEKELHIVRDKAIYNGGLQFGKTLRVFNFVVKTWVDTGIAIPQVQAGIPYRVVALYHLSNVMTFASVTINGTTFPVGKSFPTVPDNAPDHINVAWQLDSNNKGIPLSASFRCDLFTT